MECKGLKKFNFQQLKFHVPIHFNIDCWKRYAIEYWDWQVFQFALYGFPLGFPNEGHNLTSEHVSHASDKQFPSHIDHYIKEEMDYGAIYGPFDKSPIPDLHASPFLPGTNLILNVEES